MAAASLTLRAFRRQWFAIFGRILGSWTLAIGLLYGGASLMPILKPPPPPADTSQESTRGAELNAPENSRGDIERSQPPGQVWRPPGDIESKQQP